MLLESTTWRPHPINSGASKYHLFIFPHLFFHCISLTDQQTKQNPTSGTFNDLDDHPSQKGRKTIDFQTWNDINFQMSKLEKENTDLKKELKKREAQIIFVENVLDGIMKQAENAANKYYKEANKAINNMSDFIGEEFNKLINSQIARFHQLGEDDPEIDKLHQKYRMSQNLPLIVTNNQVPPMMMMSDQKKGDNAQKESPSSN